MVKSANKNVSTYIYKFTWIIWWKSVIKFVNKYCQNTSCLFISLIININKINKKLTYYKIWRHKIDLLKKKNFSKIELWVKENKE